MSRAARCSPRAALLAAVLLPLAACSGSDGEGVTGSQASNPASTVSTVADTRSTPPAEATTTTTEVRAPMFGTFDLQIALLTPAAGGGDRPFLEWTAVDGADHYGVYLYAPSGDIYWAWRGHETSVPVGGYPQLLPTSPGPSVVDGMTWAVVAYDADMLPIAVSPRREIAP